MNKKNSQVFSEKSDTVFVFYDGECPFCSNFVKMLALKKYYSVELFDLRTLPEIVQWFREEGLNVDDGMIVTINQRLYYADEAVHILALLSTNSLVGRANRLLFSRRRIARLLYPIMKTGRIIVLAILRKKKIYSSPSTPD